MVEGVASDFVSILYDCNQVLFIITSDPSFELTT